MFNDSYYIEQKQKFETYYQNELVYKFSKLETKRKLLLKIFIFLSIFVAVWVSYVIYQSITNDKVENTLIETFINNDILNSVIVVIAGIPLLLYYKLSKESMLPSLINFFGDFTYEHQNNLTNKILTSSIVDKKYNYELDDCFSGKYDDIPVDIMEYKKGQYVKENYVKKGNGIIFIAQMNKNFVGKTIVAKDIGLLNVCRKFEQTKRVKLESVDFERKFEVYSDNQIEARYLLTTVMMEYMLKLSKTFPNIQFEFYDNKVFINIETNKNLFECNNIFISVINYKRILKTFNEMFMILSIIRILKLNQKQIL